MPPDIDTSVVLPPSWPQPDTIPAETSCRFKSGHRYDLNGLCYGCGAERGEDRPTIPADLPTTKAAPKAEPFDLDAYRARKEHEEALELARLAALPNAYHGAQIIAELQKALLPDGFAARPLADLRLSLFIGAVKQIEDEL